MNRIIEADFGPRPARKRGSWWWITITISPAGRLMLQRTVVSDLQKQSDNWLELEGRVVHPMVFTKKEDVLAAGLQQGQLVDPTRHCQNEERLARRFMVAPFEIARGCTATYFPEPNVLVPIDSTADRSNTP